MSSDAVYGFKYSSSAVSWIKDIDPNKVRYVRIQWTDLINQVCCRVVPLSHFMRIFESPRRGITLPKCTLGLVFNTPVFSAIGEYLFVVDLSTLRTCPWAPNTMTIMGWFEEKIPVADPTGDLTFKVPFCPRTLLKRIMEYVDQDLGEKKKKRQKAQKFLLVMP
jgi:glutamine synthetase